MKLFTEHRDVTNFIYERFLQFHELYKNYTIKELEDDIEERLRKRDTSKDNKVMDMFMKTMMEMEKCYRIEGSIEVVKKCFAG